LVFIEGGFSVNVFALCDADAEEILSMGPDCVRGEGSQVYQRAVSLCDVVLQQYGVDQTLRMALRLINRGFIIGKYAKELADHITISLIKE
jgi:hypothetical protein